MQYNCKSLNIIIVSKQVMHLYKQAINIVKPTLQENHYTYLFTC